MTARPASSPHSRRASFVCAIRNTESEPQHTTCVCVRSQCTQQGTCARDYVLVRNRNKALAEPSPKFRSTRSVTYSSDCASSSCVTELRVGDGLNCLVCTADSNSCDKQGERADASGRGVRRFLIRCRAATQQEHGTSSQAGSHRAGADGRSQQSERLSSDQWQPTATRGTLP
jgi:hypothetical protein